MATAVPRLRGARAFARLMQLIGSIALLACAAPSLAQVNTANLTRLESSAAPVAATFKSYNRVSKESLYELSITNSSGASIRAPAYVVIEALTGAGVTVKNAAGATTTGIPYYLLSAADIAAGTNLRQNVILNNPGNVRITFNGVVYATPAPPQQPPLKVEITSPGTLITVGSTPLLVQGTINDPSAVLTLNGVPISHSAGQFQANVALIEGHNSIIARAVNAIPQESTATLSVSLDLTPPYVTIESPVNGATVTSGIITVSGLINDIVRGTVSEGQANVTVNGRAATVANRSYLAQNIPLVEGPNTILVEASDQVGNTGSAQISVNYEVPSAQYIDVAGGQAQQAQIRQVLPQTLRVKLLNATGQPVPDKPVVFRVIQGDGVVGVGGTDEGTAILVQAGANGEASTAFRLGSRAGSGNHRVSARAVGFDGEVIFVASAAPKPGDKVSVNSGNNQRGAANQPLPLPFVTVVTDDGANVLEGAEIEYKVSAGTGKFQNGQTTFRAFTDSDGRASAKLTLGPEVGLDVHRVTATLVGSELYAGFTASALQSGDPGQTSISGVVLDNQDHPLPNVTMRVEGTTREARTNAQGQFKITEVPVGPVHLIADGSTTTVPGEWPTLPYNIVTVAGADNPLPVPVYLVKLDTTNAVTVGAIDREITLPEVPGFKLTVKKDSVTFPNGDRVGQLSVTPVNTSKIPMAPPNGMQPQFIVTIQPAGARFDPPAALQLPNVDGHPPGAQVEMYSFDHDLEEFVAIGVGTVSADGMVIASNPGVGVIKAGWHCGSQPTGGGCASNCPVCQDCNSQCNCVAADSDTRIKDKQVANDCKKAQCSSGNVTQVNDDSDHDKCSECENGTVKPKEVKIENVEAKVDGADEKWKVLKGGSVSFSFTANAQSTDCDKLKYEWDFGDSKPPTLGQNVTHTFDSGLIYNVTLKVTCDGCATGPVVTDTVKAVVLDVIYEAVATVPADQKRTTIGIGEEIYLYTASDDSVDWKMQGATTEATLTADTGGSTTLTAGRDAGALKILISKPGLLDETEIVTFNVIRPNNVKMTWDGTSVFSPPGALGPGRQGAIMLTEVYLEPNTVSFYNVEVKEIDGPPSVISGYYLDPAHPADPHDASDEWWTFNQSNKSPTGDQCGAWDQPKPWSDGAFAWVVPWHFRLLGSDSEDGIFFRNVIQAFSIKEDGTMTVSKAGAVVTRSP